eukprot:CAMPEP_0172003102 /NCGR_PEP_ID=MMETSP1041-20130122/3757_1 /TAXON_ID=464988 /ORGANISM="Hemiselmis andersenii, Strain CCMP439" /LENGTH=65 /DNA_ID=CAMNT_0012656853 /DNA_START=407 /DNA_END=600 /DNA_ORIENTATION=+
MARETESRTGCQGVLPWPMRVASGQFSPADEDGVVRKMSATKIAALPCQMAMPPIRPSTGVDKFA